MRDRKGFTLIELLIVVVIIGILAAIAIPKFSATREKAYYAAMKSDLKNLATQQEIYYSDLYAYATDISPTNTTLGFSFSKGVTVSLSGTATALGWAAIAVHEALPGYGCGIFYGQATATLYNTDTPALAGVVSCTVAP